MMWWHEFWFKYHLERAKNRFSVLGPINRKYHREKYMYHKERLNRG